MKWRYNAVLLFFVFCFLIILNKLFYWQVVKADELSELGRLQYSGGINISPERGEIETSDGFPIVTNKISYLLYANPKATKDIRQTANILSPIIQVDKASISAQLALNRFWVPLANNIDQKTKDEINTHNLGNIGFQEQFQRFYPEASLAAQLVGFVGKDANGLDKGYSGLEGYYDRQLRGRVGQGIIIHDALGKPILTNFNANVTEQDGRSLVLNVDRALQFLVEQKLKEGIDLYGASGGMAAVMNPQTGAILAMASFPSFDPRSYQNYASDLYLNPFISNFYEPGSTFKPLVMAAALDSNLITPQTECPICAGPVQIGGYKIKTWNNEYFKNINMIKVIEHSDNTGMVFVAQKLGLSRMLSYLNKFGIGTPTGIDLQGEEAIALKPYDQWYPIDLATTGFGQGISMTPMQLLDAFSSIANKGKRMQPEVVNKIITPEGQTINIAPKVLGSPISEQTAKVMTEILVNAVENGEAKWTKLDGYRIAGKTGTAQIPINGHYDPNKTIASFIGFAPADDPKFAMLVIIDRPTASIYGAETAAPIFFSIAKDILVYDGIYPNKN